MMGMWLWGVMGGTWLSTALGWTRLGVTAPQAIKVFRREESSETNFRLFLMAQRTPSGPGFAVPRSASLAFSCFRVGNSQTTWIQ